MSAEGATPEVAKFGSKLICQYVVTTGASRTGATTGLLMIISGPVSISLLVYLKSLFIFNLILSFKQPVSESLPKLAVTKF